MRYRVGRIGEGISGVAYIGVSGVALFLWLYGMVVFALSGSWAGLVGWIVFGAMASGILAFVIMLPVMAFGQGLAWIGKGSHG